MNDKNTLRDDWEDRLAEQALGELLGGKRPPDLSEQILLAAASQPLAAKRRPRARLALAASLLLVAGLGGGYAAYERLHRFGSTEGGEGLVASRQESSRSMREPSPKPVDVDLEQVEPCVGVSPHDPAQAVYTNLDIFIGLLKIDQ